ncbi:MAG: sensor histidine kinase [Saprospiraceae bacterium]
MKICKKKQILGFDDTWLIIIGIPVVSLVMPLMFMQYSGSNTDSPNWYKTSVIMTFIHSCFYLFVFRKIFIFIRGYFPLFENSGKRIIYQLILVILAYFILDPLISKLCIDTFVGAGHHEHPVGVSMSVTSLVVIFLVVAIYESIYFYQQLKKSIQEKEELQRENIKSQLEGLKSKVNPHFLFNSLNTLAYLIPEDADKSVKFVQKLSKVYRYILEMSDEKLIPLHKELDFLNSYIFLLKERFEENLQVAIDIPKARMNDKIIPLSLQILFENAIKHNVISSSKPLKIKVVINEMGKLIVENNLQKKKQIKDSTKFGLENIKNRYRFFSNEAVDVIATSSSFIVSLPLISVK